MTVAFGVLLLEYLILEWLRSEKVRPAQSSGLLQ